MKIAALFALAVLSTGCATDDDTNMGGFLDGMRPAKPALDDGSGTPPNPDVFEGMEHRGMIDIPADLRVSGVYVTDIAPDVPLPDNLCGENCKVTYITIPPKSGVRDASDAGEIRLFDDQGTHICTLLLTDDGGFDTRDCVPQP